MDAEFRANAIQKIKTDAATNGKTLSDEEAEKIFNDIDDWVNKNKDLIALIQQKPEIDTVQNLLSRKRCEPCNGFGIMPNLEICQACNGTGMAT